MFNHSRDRTLLLLLLTVSLQQAALAQTVTIRGHEANTARLEATSSAETGFRFQSTTDYVNWEDYTDATTGPFSYLLDTTKDDHRFFRLRTWNIQDTPITLVMLGDSTVADYEIDNRFFWGWGAGIYGYLKPNVHAVNLAVPLASSRTFLNSIEKDHMLAIKPDFVLIHYGWLDSADPNVWGWGSTITDFEANLRQIIELVRGFKGTPIMVTPIGPRWFDDQGKFYPTLSDRCQVVRKLAAEYQTYLIDLNQLANNLYVSLGSSASAYISISLEDGAHFSEKGAEVIAGLVVGAFPPILSSQVVGH